ncbi:putative Transcription factor IBH1 [Cocos nucifera]|nr:putative Transcription factor IBH1 [Cocos nucifera]
MDDASLASLLLALISSTDISDRRPYRSARRRRKQKSTMALTKRWDLQQRARRPVSNMEKRVRALRGLVPNGESMELHGLFREATDYISCLQARIKAMEMMVKVLSDGII